MKLNKIRLQIKKIKSQVKEFLKDSKDLKSIKKFIIQCLTYGMVVNYALWGVFNIPFTLVGFPAYGVLSYFIKDELVDFIRRIRTR